MDLDTFFWMPSYHTRLGLRLAVVWKRHPASHNYININMVRCLCISYFALAGNDRDHTSRAPVE
jgi:hypothetical protein